MACLSTERIKISCTCNEQFLRKIAEKFLLRTDTRTDRQKALEREYNEMHVYTKKGVSTLTIKIQYKTISFYIRLYFLYIHVSVSTCDFIQDNL